MEERIVMVAFKPLPGKSAALEKLIINHHKILLGQGLVTQRKPIIAKASDGTFVEIFGWKSAEAINQAHQNQVVQDLWAQFAEVANYIPLSEIKEASSLFSEFEAVV
ncbi:MAG: hypothetical protein ACNS62_23170 [Candidatus Cyclobacteriaceae bacterium M3_2C_046]